MRFISIMLICLFVSFLGISQEVSLHLPKVEGKKITRNDWIGYSILSVAAFTDGVVEGYEFDNRKSFERKYDVDPDGFFGSHSWRLAYQNGNPEDGYKNFYTKHFGALDFYHVCDDIRKTGYIAGGAFVFMGSKKSKKAYLYRVIIVAAITSIFKRAGMTYIRN